MSTASPHIQTEQTRRRLAVTSCAFFAVEYLGIEIGEHHLEWDSMIATGRNLDIEAARGHGKSGFFSYAYPVWRSWRVAKNRGLLVSDTAEQVGELLRIFKEGVEFRDETGYVWRLPALIDTKVGEELVPRGFERLWTGERIFFRNGSRFWGRTFGTRFRGRHVPWMVADDPHGEDASYSETVRMRDHAFLTRVLEPMILPGGQIIVVGTPLHPDDIHGRNAKNPSWLHRKFPAISRTASGEERVLWPQFRPREHLEAKRVSMGELAFRQEYLLIPASTESSLFPPALFFERPETMASWLRLRPTEHEMAVRDTWRYCAGVDIAMSATASADYTTIIVLGVDEHRNRHVVEYVRVRGMGFSQQLRLIDDTVRPYHAAGRLDELRIEANQMQAAWPQELAASTDLPIVAHVTGAEKSSLARGVPSLRPLLENGKLRFARGDAYSQTQTDIVIGELQGFGWAKGKLQGMGQHDDSVMALWLADCAVRRAGGVAVMLIGEDASGGDGSSPSAETDAPVVAESLLGLGHADFEGAVGKALMVRQGYVTPDCTLPDEVAGPLIWREISAGRSPCWGCAADRRVCGGDPPRALVRGAAHGVAADEPPVHESAPRGVEVGAWVGIVNACRGDRWLAAIIPSSRDEQIAGWNSLVGSGERPGWVDRAAVAGRTDDLYDALHALLVARGGE